MKQYNIDNREKIKERNKQWRIDNRESIGEQKKQRYVDNRQKIKEQNKQWKIDNLDKMTIFNWKRRGLIELEGVYSYESLYEYYLSINHCEVCETKFKNSFDKCLDHCHTTNIFRWVLCRNCNTQDNWENLI